MSFFKNMNWSPIEYENASILFGEMSEEMLTRLRFFHLNPTRILDVGCGLGDGSSALQQAYPEAQVIALDLSLAMLQHTKEKHADVFYGQAGHSCLLHLVQIRCKSGARKNYRFYQF